MLSTDNESAIKTFIPNENIEKVNSCGEVVVSGRYIYEIIRKLPGKNVKIEEVIDNKINISTDNSSFNLNCNDVKEYPELDLSDSKNPIILNKKLFKTMIKQTSFATSTQENRPEFTGINIKINKNILECTATDSYRLAKKYIELDQEYDDSINIILPNKNIVELEKIISGSSDILDVSVYTGKLLSPVSNLSTPHTV